MGQIGKYETIDQLGVGAMGIVYRARDVVLDREVALKTIRTGSDVSSQTRDRFYREARACARLQHPYIVAVYELGEADSMAFIAMELLRGADFRQIIQDKRPLTVAAKIAAVWQVCEAIAHAHRHGVIHRDIKPSNLFLTDYGTAKVLDFGIARLPSSRLTVAGQVLGTPNYMAPEQILGNSVDGRADLFSVAIVLFELVTYRHPFQSSFIPKRIAQSEPDSLFDYDSSLPVILEKVIVKGLAKDPDKRYQSADEFSSDLRTILDALSQNASPTFSRVELPSERAVPTSLFSEKPSGQIAGRQVPPGENPDEWRLSEALRLMPDFEAAIDRKDIGQARTVLAELDDCLGCDIRFAQALKLCHERIEELGTPRLEAAPNPPLGAGESELYKAVAFGGHDTLPVDPGPGRMLPPEAGALPRDQSYMDGGLFTIDEVKSRGPSVDSAEVFSPVIEPRLVLPPNDDSPTVVFPPVKPPLWADRRMVFGAGAIVCLVLLTIVGIVAFRPIPVEPAVATAVARAGTTIYAGQNDQARTITTLQRDSQLNIVALPLSRFQRWTKVQLLNPKVKRPGYVQMSELRDWHGLSSPVALNLGQIMGAGESGTEQEIEAQIRQLWDVVSLFGSSPEATEARVEIARLRLALARLFKNARRVVEISGELAQAEQVLQPLPRTKRADLDRQMDAMKQELLPTADPNPPASTAAAKESPYVQDLMRQAYAKRDQADFEGAKELIQKVLRVEPRNREAWGLQSWIKNAEESEKK